MVDDIGVLLSDEEIIYFLNSKRFWEGIDTKEVFLMFTEEARKMRKRKPKGE